MRSRPKSFCRIISTLELSDMPSSIRDTTPPLNSAELLFSQLLQALQQDIKPETTLVGLHTGGVWLAERLHVALALTTPLGTLDVSYHRDDYANRGSLNLPRGARISSMPATVEGAHVVLVDDVLYTGRTVRAALNTLFDYGRPARVDLAVLVDRGGRELPFAARYCAQRLEIPLPAEKNLRLLRSPTGELSLQLETKDICDAA